MTSHDLKCILADELARVSRSPNDFGIRTGSTSFDQIIPGFAVRSYPSGKRSYLVQKRIGGRMRTITIGNASILPEAIARDAARRLILRVDLGLNPADDKKSTRSTPIYERFLDHYWKKCSPAWKLSTQIVARGYKRTILDHAFNGMFIDEITHADALRWHAQITRSNGPGAANRCLEFLRAAFGKAEQWGDLPEHHNPFWGVRRNRPRKIERYLTADEMARLGAALIKQRETNLLPATAVLLLALTGCRRGEILHLHWSELRGRRLKLSDSKTGPRIVWLGEEARLLLDALPRRQGDARVFPEVSIVNRVSYFWATVKQHAGISNLRLQDLRHSYASFAVRNSETLPMIGSLLGHARIATTQRYAHLDDVSLQASSDAIGNQIQGWLS
jgi:integrase